MNPIYLNELREYGLRNVHDLGKLLMALARQIPEPMNN